MSDLFHSLASRLSSTYRTTQTQQLKEAFLDAIVKSLKESERSKTWNLTLQKAQLMRDSSGPNSVVHFEIGARSQSESPSVKASDSWLDIYMTDVAMQKFVKLIQSDSGLAGERLDAAMKRYEEEHAWLLRGIAEKDRFYTCTIDVPLPRPT